MLINRLRTFTVLQGHCWHRRARVPWGMVWGKATPRLPSPGHIMVLQQPWSEQGCCKVSWARGSGRWPMGLWLPSLGQSVTGTMCGGGGQRVHWGHPSVGIAAGSGGAKFIHPSLSPVFSFPNQLETLVNVLRKELGRKAACRGRWSVLTFNSGKDLCQNRVKNYCPGVNELQSRAWESCGRGDAGLSLGWDIHPGGMVCPSFP